MLKEITIITLSGETSTIKIEVHNADDDILYSDIKNEIIKINDFTVEESELMVMVNHGKKIANLEEFYTGGKIVYYIPHKTKVQQGISSTQLHNLQLKTGNKSSTVNSYRQQEPESVTAVNSTSTTTISNVNTDFKISSSEIMEILKDDPLQLINILSILFIKDPFIIAKVAMYPEIAIKDLRKLINENKIDIKFNKISPELLPKLSPSDDISELESTHGDSVDDNISEWDDATSSTYSNDSFSDYTSDYDTSDRTEDSNKSGSHRYRIHIKTNNVCNNESVENVEQTDNKVILCEDGRQKYLADKKNIDNIIDIFDLSTDMFDLIKSLYLLFDRDFEKTKNYVKVNYLASNSNNGQK